MKVFEEITKWQEKTPNHTYFMDDSKSRAYAYIPAGKTELFKFSTPLKLDVRGRKFREIPNTTNFSVDEELPKAGKSFTVTGSKGDKYTVTEKSGHLSCSCTGYQFRGKCRHIDSIASQTK